MMIQKLKRILLMGLAGLIALTACNPQGVTPTAPPTLELVALISITPRQTATRFLTLTPLPTFTYTPSLTPIPPTPSNTPTLTATPPVTGIIASLQTVNIREGPGVDFRGIIALDPGTGVLILGTSPDSNWFNIRLDDGREGWVSARLVRVDPTPTVFPTLTLSPDFTALALGTPLPTAILGGGTITATPPSIAVTATPPTAIPTITPTGGPTQTLGVPTIDTTSMFQSAFLTATALAGGIQVPTNINPTLQITPAPGSAVPTPAATTSGGGSVQQGVDVLAYCDNPIFGSPPPRNLAAGSTIDVFWTWYARTREQAQSHIDNAIYEVRVNGELIENWQQFTSSIRLEGDGNYHVYWFIRSDPLPAGQNVITYNVTWRNRITDGYNDFGPETNRPSETGTCTFSVR